MSNVTSIAATSFAETTCVGLGGHLDRTKEAAYSLDGIFRLRYSYVVSFDENERGARMEPKPVRFRLFLERLQQAPPAQSFDEAFRQIADVLNEVENEFADIPYDPEAWESDGRMYPPQLDSERVIEGQERVRRFRSRAHNTFVGANGSIEIQEVNAGTVVFTKDGADGKSVWDQ
ncbi:MAG: hypothetical protein WD875_07570 [Pirellulales bacterium]